MGGLAVAVLDRWRRNDPGAPGQAAFAAKPAPCATQQVHVDKAGAKLADLTAKFAAHPTKKNLKAKKAQVQRVARATNRLEKCLAAETE